MNIHTGKIRQTLSGEGGGGDIHFPLVCLGVKLKVTVTYQNSNFAEMIDRLLFFLINTVSCLPPWPASLEIVYLSLKIFENSLYTSVKC